MAQSVRSKIIMMLFVACSMQVHATTFVEVFTILSRYVKNPTQVGEIAPLSHLAGAELASFVGKSDAPQTILEAGGGCGAVTIKIAEQLRAGDILHVIEIDPKMCEILKKRLASYPNVTVHCCSILDWKPAVQYDLIVCTLPFNSLGLDFTRQAIDYFQKVSAKNAIFSYVEYPIVRQAIQYLYSSIGRQKFREVQAFMEVVRCNFLKTQKMIYRNVPPIKIYHLQFNVA